MFTGLESPTHWIVVLVVALLVFGPKRLPDLGRSLGGGLRELRDAMSGAARDDEPRAEPEPDPAPRPKSL